MARGKEMRGGGEKGRRGRARGGREIRGKEGERGLGAALKGIFHSLCTL